MKFVIVLALVAVVAARPDDHYDSKYDSINYKEIIENERLLTAYLNCFNDLGKCTPEGLEIKGLIPDGVQSSCSKCTEKQKVMAANIIAAAQTKQPEKWKILNDKHNPGGKYDDVLAKFLKDYNH